MNRIPSLSALLLSTTLAAQQRPLPLKYPARPTVAAITPADLMTRLYLFADDSMMGRLAGTPYHDKATDYIGREAARLGLTPAGDNGTFFQNIPLMLREAVPGSKIAVDGREYVVWRDFLPRDNGPTARSFDNTTAVFGGTWGDTANMLSADAAAGKVVVIRVPTGWQANRGALVQQYLGAAAIVVASMDSMPAPVRQDLAQPAPLMKEASAELPPLPAFFYSSDAMTTAMFGAPITTLKVGMLGKTIAGGFTFGERQAPGSRNVVAILQGSDAKLRGQYVAIGAHSDHIGFDRSPVDHDSLYAFYHVVRPKGADDGGKTATPDDWPKVRTLLDSLRKVHSARTDSIYNGADDDGSGSMGLLEIAEAFAGSRDRPRRSLLFIWHVGEEEGLWGSQHFTDHPTVARDSIVAEINIDMIGRGNAADITGGGAGYLQLIGAKRLSTELGALVETEGKKFTNPPFKFDYQFDANGHPQQYYCRSDHYMYARYGIPIVFMSTGGHPEYHQVTDEPQYIDYDQLARVSRLVQGVATRVANLDHRLVVDKPKPDPKGNCVQ